MPKLQQAQLQQTVANDELAHLQQEKMPRSNVYLMKLRRRPSCDLKASDIRDNIVWTGLMDYC